MTKYTENYAVIIFHIDNKTETFSERCISKISLGKGINFLQFAKKMSYVTHQWYQECFFEATEMISDPYEFCSR